MRTLRIGRRLGKYRLDGRLGEGGSATVWRARDTVEGRSVALKVALPALVDEFGREAVEAEARLSARLDHPRILRLCNADWIDDLFVLATPLAKASLEDLSKRQRTPSLGLVLIDDLSAALAHAHERGVIHRDIKPGNVLIGRDGRALLSDFGTARLAPAHTAFATEVGTFGYMAPEQAYGRPGYASDVFSLALTIYEAFAGVLPGWPFEWPLEGEKRFESRCPEPIRAVLRDALAVDLERRTPDGIAFRRAVEQAQERLRRADARSVRRPRRRRPSPPEDPFTLETEWFRKRFGRTFETHFDCHACDGPVSESMRSCPWCGTTRNSFREVTGFPIVCPVCERGVRSEWSACPTCTSGRFESDGRALPRGAKSERTCSKPGCGAPLQRFMHYCPACKTRVARPWKVEGLATCPHCRWSVAPRWRFCGWCGKRNARALEIERKKRRGR
ncbi:MAG: serine/threonine-protein kinase [bacterium]|nr:serine/threonine-protein kinase [bacterium]